MEQGAAACDGARGGRESGGYSDRQVTVMFTQMMKVYVNIGEKCPNSRK